MAANTEVVKAAPAPPPTSSANAVATMVEELAMLQPEISRVLPEHVKPERFMRIVATAMVLNPELRAPALRRSLLTAATKAATDGLVPDGREGAFVIFKNKEGDTWVPAVQWMPMIAGVIKKVRNSGELKSLNSNVVHVKDTFRYWIDDDGEHVLHEPNLTDAERGEITCVYAVAKTHKGGVYTEVMTRGQVDQVRKASKAPNSPAWTQWYGEMGRKAVVRRLAKRLPMSSDLEQVIQRDDELFDFDPPKQVKASTSGTSAARRALGIDKEASATNGSDDAGDHYTEETAIAALRATTTIEQLEAVRAEVFADFEGRGLPLNVEAVANDHRETLAE
jgi:recombination protein RecT